MKKFLVMFGILLASVAQAKSVSTESGVAARMLIRSVVERHLFSAISSPSDAQKLEARMLVSAERGEILFFKCEYIVSTEAECKIEVETQMPMSASGPATTISDTLYVYTSLGRADWVSFSPVNYHD
jgi:hypothetical protein